MPPPATKAFDPLRAFFIAIAMLGSRAILEHSYGAYAPVLRHPAFVAASLFAALYLSVGNVGQTVGAFVLCVSVVLFVHHFHGKMDHVPEQQKEGSEKAPLNEIGLILN